MENKTFTVSPMSHRFYLEAGKTYSGKLTIVNPADAKEDFSYKVTVSPYGVSGEDYTADLVTETNRTQLIKWIEINEPTGTVKPNETKEVKFTIAVPENVPAGGQYATIAVSSNSDIEATEGVAIDNIFELASVVYANVAGETEHGGEILENTFPGFVTSAPVVLKAKLTNTGNVHEDATFVIEITNTFTGEVILPTEEANGQYNEIIMPETTREITREVDNLPALGIVNIKQIIYYQGEVSEFSRNVVICPIWFLILAFLTITALVATVVTLVRKHIRRKKAAA